MPVGLMYHQFSHREISEEQKKDGGCDSQSEADENFLYAVLELDQSQVPKT